MSLRNALRLPHQRRQLSERNKFVGSSLTSSRTVSERTLAWSGSNDRGRLFPMTFHEEWRHPSCPVMKWYRQQFESSTQFQSIEHRRNADGPFYHEFLLLKLTDGAVCRVERTGEGSRADAIRPVGCRAHDLIQWFTKDDYGTFSARVSTTLIAELDLGREFDILDVLAICYSIQNTKPCRVYTLQRYNCYFLCLTVLAVLTRRVASWETKIGADEWNLAVGLVFESLNCLSSEESKMHMILRICAHLEPDNPHATRPLLGGLRTQLGSRAGALVHFSESIRSTLWQADWHSGSHSGLFESVHRNVSQILGDSSCGKQLRVAMNTRQADSQCAIASSELLADRYIQAYAEEENKKAQRLKVIYKHLWRMWSIGYPVPFDRMVLSRVLGRLISLIVPLLPASTLGARKDSNDFDRRLLSRWPFKVAAWRNTQLTTSTYFLNTFDDSNKARSIYIEALRLSNDESPEPFLSSLLDTLAAEGVLGPVETSLVIADQLDSQHLAELLVSLVASGLNQTLFKILQGHQAYLGLTLQDKGELGKSWTTTSDFQNDYIKKRNDAHAKRVAVHQLAAAPLVVEDIERTMTEVWNELPPGFGGFVRAEDNDRPNGCS